MLASSLKATIRLLVQLELEQLVLLEQLVHRLAKQELVLELVEQLELL